MGCTYEFRSVDCGLDRPKLLGLFIDGVDAEYYTDPMQALPSALREAQGNALEATEICNERAERVLTRLVRSLQAGSMIPGGIPFQPGVGLDTRRVPAKKRRTEKDAVEAFLNRGGLKGLDSAQRLARINRRQQNNDHAAQWVENRKKLIESKEAELASLLKKQAESTDADPVTARRLSRDIAYLRNDLAALKAPILAASHGFQYAYGQYLTKQVDLVNDDIRLLPLMTNTTVDTERDGATAISVFTTLDAFDGANAPANGAQLDSQAVNIDDANDRAEFDAADETLSALGAGTRSIQGLLLFSWITNLNSSLPLHYLEFASSKTPDGSDFVLVFNAEGILQAADG